MPGRDNKDSDYVEAIVKPIVDNPGDVKVERRVDEMGVLLSLEVNPADMGRVIGRQGRTAKAIRTLLRILGAKENARLNLKIVEPGGKEVTVPEEKEEKAEKEEKQEDPTAVPKIE